MLIIAFAFLCGVCGYYLSCFKINLPCYIDSALVAMPFFVIGFIFRKYTNILYPQKYDKYNWIFIVISTIILLLFAHFENFRTMTFETNIFQIYLFGFIGTLSVLFFCKYFKHIPFISYCGRYSIIILVTHRHICGLLSRLVKSHFVIDTTFMVLIVFLLTMLICYSLIPFMKKYCGYITAQKDFLPIK